MAKLKHLLMKGKRELSEGKKREEELQASLSGLREQLEEERQGSELAKVEVSQVTARIQSIKQQVLIVANWDMKENIPAPSL